MKQPDYSLLLATILRALLDRGSEKQGSLPMAKELIAALDIAGLRISIKPGPKKGFRVVRKPGAWRRKAPEVQTKPIYEDGDVFYPPCPHCGSRSTDCGCD